MREIQKLEKLISEQRLVDAQKLLRQIVLPEHLELFYKGLILFFNQEFLESAKLFKSSYHITKELRYGIFLSKSLIQQNRLIEATLILKEEIRKHPVNVEIYLLLSLILQRENKLSEARQLLMNGMHIIGDNLSILKTLARVNYKMNLTRNSIELYEKALRIKQDNSVLNDLAVCYMRVNQFEKAEKLFLKAIRLSPSSSFTFKNLSEFYFKVGKLNKSNDFLDQYIITGKELSKEDGVLLKACRCPIVPVSQNETELYLKNAIRTLQKLLSENLKHNIFNLYKKGIYPAAELIYLDGNIEKVRSLFSQLVEVPNGVEQFLTNPIIGTLGIVVTKDHIGVFQKCYYGWCLKQLKHYQITIITDSTDTEFINRIQQDDFSLHKMSLDLAFTAHGIGQLRLEHLIYWESGTDKLNYFLPYFRLAPNQYITWGWPISTRLNTVDHYISYDAIDNIGLNDHEFSENIHSLAEPPFYLKENLSDSLSDDFRTDFLVNQNLRKITPEFDKYVLELLIKNPSASLTFIGDKNHFINQKFIDRIKADCEQVYGRITILPWLSSQEYNSVIQNSTILLDTFNYSAGANTLYDCFKFGKPIITLEGKRSKSRFTTGILQKVGLNILIGHNIQDCVQIASDLIGNTKRKHFISEVMKNNIDIIFRNDSSPERLKVD